MFKKSKQEVPPETTTADGIITLVNELNAAKAKIAELEQTLATERSAFGREIDKHRAAAAMAKHEVIEARLEGKRFNVRPGATVYGLGIEQGPGRAGHRVVEFYLSADGKLDARADRDYESLPIAQERFRVRAAHSVLLRAGFEAALSRIPRMAPWEKAADEAQATPAQ